MKLSVELQSVRKVYRDTFYLVGMIFLCFDFFLSLIFVYYAFSENVKLVEVISELNHFLHMPQI